MDCFLFYGRTHTNRSDDYDTISLKIVANANDVELTTLIALGSDIATTCRNTECPVVAHSSQTEPAEDTVPNTGLTELFN